MRFIHVMCFHNCSLLLLCYIPFHGYMMFCLALHFWWTFCLFQFLLIFPGVIMRILHKMYLNIRSYGTDCCVIGSHKFSFKITVSFPKWLYQVQSHRNVREFHLLHILAQNKLMLGMLEDGKEYLNCTFVYGFIAGLSFCQLTRLTILTTICIFLITVAPQ